MALEEKTLGELLSDPRISLVASDAIKNMDLRQDEKWNKTLAQLKEEHFGGGLGSGFERLFAAAESGEWYFPLYSVSECREDTARKGVNIIWLPSDQPEADERPFILVVPGGGFENVWNLTEGWPVAAQFNRLGYHAFVLTYQVEGDRARLDKNMEDFARALRLIRENEGRFRLHADRYITCGFSAAGYLVCLWNTLEKGYAAFGLPKPKATFPLYPFISLKLEVSGFDPNDVTEEEMKEAEEWNLRLYGCSIFEAMNMVYEIPEHAEGFPPCAIFLTADDQMVSPDNSRILAAALEKLSIPCRLEIGPEGGHGFADGSWMCMEGWTERAVRWVESLS